MIVGVDEAGRGPLAGAVTSCALYLEKNPPLEIKDSKELTPQAREKIFCWLQNNALFSVSIATHTEIDRFNILNATFLSFERSISGLIRQAPYLKKAMFIIDGNLFRTNLDIKYKCIPKADKTVKQVSCASIIAKVTRDHLMNSAHFLYPEWNFAKHKGYPTKEHYSLIKKYALSPLHRRSFRLG